MYELRLAEPIGTQKTCSALLRYNFLEKVVYLLLGSSVVTDLHAACISRNGGGILLFGNSGAGKSTLAYACARAGVDLYLGRHKPLSNQHDSPAPQGDWTLASTAFPSFRQDSLPRAVQSRNNTSHGGKSFHRGARLRTPQLTTANEVGNPRQSSPPQPLSVRSRKPHATVPKGTATTRSRQELYSAGEIRANHEKILEALSGIPTYDLQYSEFNQGIRQLERLAQDTLGILQSVASNSLNLAHSSLRHAFMESQCAERRR